MAVAVLVDEGVGGGLVYERAKAAGLGRELPTEWFLQDIRN
jgi:hypothetical protein